jgi:hypothetical protein
MLAVRRVIAQKIAGQAVIKFELGTCHEPKIHMSR